MSSLSAVPQVPAVQGDVYNKLLDEAESIALRCDTTALLAVTQRLQQMFQRDAIKQFDGRALQQLRQRLLRYQRLCAALQYTMRQALQVTAGSKGQRYAAKGKPLVELLPRSNFETYG